MTAPVASAAEPPRAATTGTIRGRLVYAAGPVPAIKLDVKEGDPKVKDEVCKKTDIVNKDLVVDPATKGVGNAIAYLVKPTGDYKATEEALLEKNPKVVIDQVGCEFLPYAAVVHKDQKLIFKSSDPVGHNVHFTPMGSNPAMNQMLPPNGSMTYAIKKEERRPTPVVCDIHPWMKSYFFIIDHPFGVVTSPDGSFEIADVPAGTQMMVVWQGAKGYVNEGGNKGMKVTVKAGETTDVGEVKITK